MSVHLDPPKGRMKKIFHLQDVRGTSIRHRGHGRFLFEIGKARCCSNHAMFTFQQSSVLFILHVTVSLRFGVSLDDLGNLYYISEKMDSQCSKRKTFLECQRWRQREVLGL